LVARSAVAAKLLVDIADRTDLELFSEELRRRPVHMEVDAVLVLGRGIDEVVGEATGHGKFAPGLRVEIGIGATGVDRAVAYADVGEVAGVVEADRNVAGDVEHVVVDALVPAQARLRVEVAEADGFAEVLARERAKREGSHGPADGGVHGRVSATENG